MVIQLILCVCGEGEPVTVDVILSLASFDSISEVNMVRILFFSFFLSLSLVLWLFVIRRANLTCLFARKA